MKAAGFTAIVLMLLGALNAHAQAPLQGTIGSGPEKIAAFSGLSNGDTIVFPASFQFTQIFTHKRDLAGFWGPAVSDAIGTTGACYIIFSGVQTVGQPGDITPAALSLGQNQRWLVLSSRVDELSRRLVYLQNDQLGADHQIQILCPSETFSTLDPLIQAGFKIESAPQGI